MAGVTRYLLVLDGETSSRIELHAGEFRVGGPGADLQVADIDESVAVLRSSQRRVTLVVAKSCGAKLRINGHGARNSQVLTSGDTLTLAHTTIVFQSSTPASPPHQILDEASFLGCLNTELERARRCERALPILLAQFETIPDWPTVPDTLADRFRVSDILARGPGNQLMVLMPEAGPEIAPIAAQRILDAFSCPARVGLAVCPADGVSADALLASARAAVAAVPMGQVGVASETYEAFTAGEHNVVVADPAMLRVYDLMRRVARSDLSVLITGETGTGKEVAAFLIHAFSPREKRTFVAFNCAAIPDELLESELFGHARGAFTGAVATKPGRIEHADGGTLFLDEVADLSPAAQAKLLRVLETHSVVRLGDVRPKAVDIRIVAATNQNIDEAVSEGKFRKDLYFRLGGATLWLPPLRDRPRDLLILARKFLATACAKIGREQMLLKDAAMYQLAFHDWPGNIRELRNLMTFIATTAATEYVEPGDIHARLQQGLRSVVDTPSAGPVSFRPLSEEVRELEVERMSAALAHTGGNQTQAAKLLSVPLRTFVNKLKRYGLHVNRN